MTDVTQKQNVIYIEALHIQVGQSASVIVDEHPKLGDLRFDRSGGLVHTSTVLKYDQKTGDFETRNSFYKKAK